MEAITEKFRAELNLVYDATERLTDVCGGVVTSSEEHDGARADEADVVVEVSHSLCTINAQRYLQHIIQSGSCSTLRSFTFLTCSLLCVMLVAFDNFYERIL